MLYVYTDIMQLSECRHFMTSVSRQRALQATGVLQNSLTDTRCGKFSVLNWPSNQFHMSLTACFRAYR